MADPDGEDAPPVFGPTALATPANLVTVARIAASPVFIWMIVRTDEARWSTFAVGFAIAMTDYLDGWLARRWWLTSIEWKGCRASAATTAE